MERRGIKMTIRRENPDHDHMEYLPPARQKLRDTERRNLKQGYKGYSVPMTDQQYKEWEDAVNKSK